MDNILLKNERKLVLIAKALKKYHGAKGSSLSDIIASSKKLSRNQTVELNRLLDLVIELAGTSCASKASQQAFVKLVDKLAKDIGLDDRSSAVKFVVATTVLVVAGSLTLYFQQHAELIKLFLGMSTFFALPALILAAIYYRVRRIGKALQAPRGPITSYRMRFTGGPLPSVTDPIFFNMDYYVASTPGTPEGEMNRHTS